MPPQEQAAREAGEDGEQHWGREGGAGSVLPLIDSLQQRASQNLPDATPPIAKIHHISQIAITFEPVM